MDAKRWPDEQAQPIRPIGMPSSVGGLAVALWCVVVISAVYFAREIVLPFALAVLFTFLLVPLVRRLERHRVPRVAAVLGVVGVAVVAVAFLSYVVFGQLYDLADHLPSYEGNIIAKVKSLEPSGEGVVSKISRVFDHLRSALRPGAGTKPDSAPRPEPDSQVPVTPQSDARAEPNSTPRAEVDQGPDAEQTAPPAAEALAKLGLTNEAAQAPPVRVEVVNPVSVWGVFRDVLGPLLDPLALTFLVAVFVIFMLLEHDKLRNRFIQLIGPQQINFTTQALDAAADRVSRYLQMLLIVNSIYGGIATAGLFVLGVPNPILWGTLAGLLRFVPFIGPIAGGLIPFLISLAVSNGWLHPLGVLALFVLDELIAGNVLEPLLFGSSVGISPLAVITSMVFWLWLWGPVGLILAMPLTVCLTVMGNYVPRLSFLTTLLSDEDALSPPVRFYQRLLAFDVEESLEICDDYQKQSSAEALCDDVLIPALRLAQSDRHRATADDSKYGLVIQTVRDVVEDLAARPAGSVATPAAGSATESSQVDRAPGAEAAADGGEAVAALCLPARDEADEVVGLMLVELLRCRGVSAAVLSPTSLASEMVSEVASRAPAVVCVSALPPFSLMHARYLCKRLAPEIAATTTLVVGLWQPGEESLKGYEKLAQTGVSGRFSSVTEATDAIAKLVTSNRLLNCA